MCGWYSATFLIIKYLLPESLSTFYINMLPCLVLFSFRFPASSCALIGAELSHEFLTTEISVILEGFVEKLITYA